MPNHECSPVRYCMCSMDALEPNEQCPVHSGAVSNRCGICGRYIRPETGLNNVHHTTIQ